MSAEREINEVVLTNLKKLMERNGTNPSRAAKEAGLGHTAIRDYFTGKVSSLRVETLARLADHFNVPIDSLLRAESVPEAEAELLLTFRKLPAEQQRLLLSAARSWVKQG